MIIFICIHPQRYEELIILNATSSLPQAVRVAFTATVLPTPASRVSPSRLPPPPPLGLPSETDCVSLLPVTSGPPFGHAPSLSPVIENCHNKRNMSQWLAAMTREYRCRQLVTGATNRWHHWDKIKSTRHALALSLYIFILRFVVDHPDPKPRPPCPSCPHPSEEDLI